MTPANIITLIAFVAVVLLGLLVLVLADWRNQQPKQLIRKQLDGVVALTGKALSPQIAAEFQRARQEALRRRRRQAMGTLGYYLGRLEVVGGRNATIWLGLVIVAALALAFFLLGLKILPTRWWLIALAIIVWPIAAAVWFYRWQIRRFSNRFLGQLPDAMDMIVRASQAGVPVTRSIRTVGQSFPAPLGPEFLKMGDSLLLGNDLQEVMEEAVQRIAVPEFSFFSVCVLLQRESGGSVSEALENLANIIRARRELALKARALTAEGRLSGMVLSALPFLLVGIMYFTSHDYINVLFTTDSGQTLLTVAAIMLLLGVLSIRKLSQLKV